MNKHALNLFLNECTALSLKDADETQGGLASALQKRHKIRETDITNVFDKASAEDEGDFARIYLATLLVLLCGAAYDSLHPLVFAKKKHLGKARVAPHWDPTRKYDLESIFAHEPMNLFPGWSSTNLRNNKSMLDSHWLTVNNNTVSTDLHGQLQSGGVSSGDNYQIARQLSPDDAQALAQREKGGNLSGKSRRMSEYSSSIDIQVGTWQKRVNNLSGPHTIQYDQQRALKKFRNLQLELQQTTQAGQNHYTELLNALTQRGFVPGDAAFDNITSAKNYWVQHRNQINKEVDKFIVEIGGKALANEPNVMSLTHATKKF